MLSVAYFSIRRKKLHLHFYFSDIQNKREYVYSSMIEISPKFKIRYFWSIQIWTGILFHNTASVTWKWHISVWEHVSLYSSFVYWLIFLRIWNKMQFYQLRTWHLQHQNRFAQMLYFRNYDCYFCNYLARLHIFRISEWYRSCVQTRIAGCLLNPMGSIITYFSSHYQVKHLCACLSSVGSVSSHGQARCEGRDWIHVCSSMAIYFCRNQQQMGPHWRSRHIGLIMKRLRKTELARNVQGLRYYQEAEYLKVGNSLGKESDTGRHKRSDGRMTNTYPQPLRNMKGRKTLLSTPTSLLPFLSWFLWLLLFFFHTGTLN